MSDFEVFPVGGGVSIETHDRICRELHAEIRKLILENGELRSKTLSDAVLAEREMCAKVCEHKMPQPVVNWSDAQIVEALRNCAAAIRARGTTREMSPYWKEQHE